MLRSLILLVPALCGGGLLPLAAHSHVEVRFTDGSLRLALYDFDEGDLDPAVVPVFVGLPARQVIPAAYTGLLGPAGSPVWMLPQNENPLLPFLGLGAESIAAGSLLDARLTLTLRRVAGPGELVVFQTLPFGQPKVMFSTRDGLPDGLVLRAGPGTHVHCNWAFTAPGTYRATFEATAKLPAGLPVTSGEVTFTFIVVPPLVPTLSAPRVNADGSLTVTLGGPVTGPVELQASADLVNWQTATTVTLSGVPREITLPVPSGNLPERFVRAFMP